MKRFVVSLCILLGMLFSFGFGSTGGTSPAHAASNQMPIKGELMASDSTTVVQLVEYQGYGSRQPWWNAKQAIKEIIEKRHIDSLGVPKQEIREFLSESLKEAMHFYMEKKPEVSFRMTVDIPPGVNLAFNGPGSLRLIIKKPDGQTVRVLDQGIVFLKEINPDTGVITKWEDTVRGTVIVSAGFTEGLPASEPLRFFVQVPERFMGYQVLKVIATDRLTISQTATVTLR
ncbi:MAG: hypothetical protein ABIF80_01020 [Patescibacteria group bacterium]